MVLVIKFHLQFLKKRGNLNVGNFFKLRKNFKMNYVFFIKYEHNENLVKTVACRSRLEKKQIN